MATRTHARTHHGHGHTHTGVMKIYARALPARTIGTQVRLSPGGSIHRRSTLTATGTLPLRRKQTQRTNERKILIAPLLKIDSFFSILFFFIFIVLLLRFRLREDRLFTRDRVIIFINVQTSLLRGRKGPATLGRLSLPEGVVVRRGIACVVSSSPVALGVGTGAP